MNDLSNTARFYSARPTLTLDGREEPALSMGLLTLSVTETTAGLFCCEARFGNWGSTNQGVDYLYFDRNVFDFGRSLSIYMGEGAGQIFEGRIMAIEGLYPQERPPEICLLAEDRFQDLRMVRRSRSFEDVSDRDVITQIANEHNLKTEIDVDGPNYRILTQLNQSDLAFLRERVRAIDAELWVAGDTLYAQARTRRKSAELTLTYRSRLLEFSVIADLAQQRSSLTVSGWDVEAKESIEQQANESAIQAELNGGLSGSQVLANSFGQRPEQIVHRVPLSIQEAEAQANAHYRQMARQFIRGQAVAEGDARLRVGTHIRLLELGPLFDGRYYVTEVKHTFDSRQGYRTWFKVERPGLGTQTR